ncbi:alpha/beta hydrolase family protein [Steroidobacter sp.]|uniref:alpha/beta hydrolase family protein n=1 Tax=Steroidobacter sp. TaxID=1978227 RepID=UPI001A4CA953|nr:hypothetical protein [Steroidobacter sp.]MBL8271468.1 hypothetical protein [Steroidobacter sp.]
MIASSARCLLLLAALGAPAVVAAAEFRVPTQVFAGEPRGPYQTGTFQELWVNTAQDDPSTADPNDKRKMMVQVWYPASPPANAKRAPYAINPQLYAKDHWVQKLSHVQTQSVLNAPLVASPRRLPILLYNHGNTQPHFSATFQTEFLASQGYVVVAIDHPGSSNIERFLDGTSYRNDGQKWQARPNQAGRGLNREALEYGFANSDISLFVKDMSFVLDRLTALHADPKSRFHQRLDLERVGALGWSLGGVASLQASRDDARIKAAADLDGWAHGIAGPKGVVTLGSERPVLLMFNPFNAGLATPPQPGGEVDAGYIEAYTSAALHFWQLLHRSTNDWYHLTIARTHHGTFSDMPLFEPASTNDLHPRAAHAIINAYTLEFFDRYVRGVEKTPLLSGETNYPEVTLLRRSVDAAARQ